MFRFRGLDHKKKVFLCLHFLRCNSTKRIVLHFEINQSDVGDIGAAVKALKHLVRKHDPE